MGYRIMAGLILLAFYGIYFGKMYLQKRQGIVTDQLGKGRKNKNLLITELIMKVVTFGTVIAEILSIILVKDKGLGGIQFLGMVIAIGGVTVFAVAVKTMKDSWRAGIPDIDSTAMVTGGIYSISRNPAFVGFDLVYLGILIMFFNWALLAVSALAMGMLHLQMLQEEKYLTGVFGVEYLAYRNRTMRYVGRRKNVHTKRKYMEK